MATEAPRGGPLRDAKRILETRHGLSTEVNRYKQFRLDGTYMEREELVAYQQGDFKVKVRVQQARFFSISVVAHARDESSAEQLCERLEGIGLEAERDEERVIARKKRATLADVDRVAEVLRRHFEEERRAR